jgi:hypothetical protein
METIMADLVSRTPAIIERAGAATPKGFPAAIADILNSWHRGISR